MPNKKEICVKNNGFITINTFATFNTFITINAITPITAITQKRNLHQGLTPLHSYFKTQIRTRPCVIPLKIAEASAVSTSSAEALTVSGSAASAEDTVGDTVGASAPTEKSTENSTELVVNPFGIQMDSETDSFGALDSDTDSFGTLESNATDFLMPGFPNQLLTELPGILWSSKGETLLKFKALLSLYPDLDVESTCENNLQKAIDLINSFLSEFNQVNKKGYINYKNINNLPVIRDLYASLITKEINGEDLKSVIKNLDYGACAGLVKWSYNLYIMHLLIFTRHLITKSTILYNIQDSEPSVVKDLNQLDKELSGCLDSMVRLKLRKIGVSLSQNIYCGYDSEYKKVDMKFNKLLSVQLALSTQTILKLPTNTEFTFGYKSKSGEFFSDTPDSILETEKILGCLRSGIKIYRFLKYGNYDDSLNLLVSGLKSSGKSVFIDGDQFHVIFPNTPIKQHFQRLDSYSLKTLVQTSLELVKNDLIDSSDSILTELKDLHDSQKRPEPSDTSALESLDAQQQQQHESLNDLINIDKLPNILNLALDSIGEATPTFDPEFTQAPEKTGSKHGIKRRT